MGYRQSTLEGLEMNKIFWEGKNVLVTGHTGFKGSWLSLWLQSLGANVVGYALTPPTPVNLFETAQVAQGMTSLTGDVRNLESLKTTVAEHRPDIVFHLAAQALVRYSYEDPIRTVSTNVLGTANILETIRLLGTVRVVVCITSDKCYENKEWFWGYRENESLGGHDPYSASKGCAEMVIKAYRDSYFPPSRYEQHQVALASTRAGNVIGGGDWARDRLIPDIIAAIRKNQPAIIRNPKSTRPWQHVLEPLSGYIVLAEKLWKEGPRFAQAWNFGPNDDQAKPVSWIADYLTSQWSENSRWELDAAQHPHEDSYLKLDCSKAKSLLNWAPRLNLAQALDWIIEWNKAHQKDQNMRDITERQIARYSEQGGPR